MTRPIVTRFAPSPTGFMHIGSARTALYAYVWAKKCGGTFILRIEDTDKSREVPGSIEHIEATLGWLGLTYDFGPRAPGPWGSNIQSERLSTYRAAAEQLYKQGLAYPDPFTKEELDALRAEAEAEKRPFLVREHRPDTTVPWDGTRALRFKHTALSRSVWTDAVRGDLSAGPEALDDFVILKADGYPTYNFAHIVDDAAMGVTHVVRGDEFIASTPNYLALYDALGIPRPVFVTVPPILKDDRTKKLGKRDGAKDILEYRKEGYLPEAMNNYLALLGWNPGTDQEVFTMDELVTQFDIGRIHVSGAAFNETKLQWINREHMQKLSAHLFWEHAEECLTPETVTMLDAKNLWSQVVPLMRERASTFGDIGALDREGEYRYYYETPVVEPSKLCWKGESQPATKTRLEAVLGLLEGVLDPWSADSVKAAVWDYAEKEGKGQVLWPMRVALSGKDKSPDPFVIAGIIGRDETLDRIRAACRVL
jgi:glutamyl-tRNA synthetase